MDREQIIRMAREAVRLPEPQTPQEEAIERALAPIFERFAALVAAAERDRMCQQFNIPKELAHEKATGNEAD